MLESGPALPLCVSDHMLLPNLPSDGSDCTHISCELRGVRDYVYLVQSHCCSPQSGTSCGM